MFSEETNDAVENNEDKKPAKKAAPKKAAAEKSDAPKAKAASKPKAEKTAEKPAAKAKKAEAPVAEKAAPKAKAPKAKKESADDSVVRIRLENIKPAEGSRRALNRVGRGRASGSGKTCNRGHNGEGQRAGCSTKRGFEGGQMPMYRRMPKINGFKIIRNKTWLELTTKQLETLSKRHGNDLSAQKLEELGLYNPRRMYGIRVYGNLTVTSSFKVQAHHVTEGAKSAIEKAGGSVSSLSA